jgi:RimJ/RimL family protein N-acetyltransferase
MRRTGDEKLEECDFIIMGQICIVKDFRGQGLFNGLYQCFKKNYFEQYKAVVTEISIHNRRSLYAHLKIGFNEIERYTDSKDEWVVVEWEWSS